MTLVVPTRVIARIMERVVRRGPDECWPPVGALSEDGYGRASWRDEDGKMRGTSLHRVVWMHFHGPIPDDLQVDHFRYCAPCCNPAHLRLRTLSQNASDNGHARKTQCPKGHPYDEENTYRHKRGRSCRTCERKRTREAARARRLEQRNAA